MHSSTRVVWSSTPEGDLERGAAFVTAEKRLGAKSAVQIGAGATLDGTLESAGTRHRLRPGWAGFVSFTSRLVDGAGWRPLVMVTGTVSFSSTRTVGLSDPREYATLTAFDLRGGVVVGKTILDRVTPFVVARVFGGPIAWSLRGRDQTGTDLHHVQLGGGAVVSLPPVDVYLEGVPLGERALGGGVGLSF
jgi:hypothetical protein